MTNNQVPLSDIFTIQYGNKFDWNKMTQSDDGINFVSRQKGVIVISGV